MRSQVLKGKVAAKWRWSQGQRAARAAASLSNWARLEPRCPSLVAPRARNVPALCSNQAFPVVGVCGGFSLDRPVSLPARQCRLAWACQACHRCLWTLRQSLHRQFVSGCVRRGSLADPGSILKGIILTRAQVGEQSCIPVRSPTFRRRLMIGPFWRSAAAGGRCFLLTALKGHQQVAQASEGQEPVAPPWVSVSPNSLLSPRIACFSAIRGRGQERGTRVADGRVSRFNALCMFARTKREFRRSARSPQ